MKYIKKAVWNILNWFDNVFFHSFLDRVLDVFPVENKDGSDSWSFVFYEKVNFRFCCWVNIDLFEKWFPEEFENASYKFEESDNEEEM